MILFPSAACAVQRVHVGHTVCTCPKLVEYGKLGLLCTTTVLHFVMNDILN